MDPRFDGYLVGRWEDDYNLIIDTSLGWTRGPGRDLENGFLLHQQSPSK